MTAKSVYNRYLGFGDDYHTLMGLFREQLASYKEKIGKEKAASTYRGLVADYKNLQLFLKEKRRIEDIAIAELDKKFITTGCSGHAPWRARRLSAGSTP